MKASYNVAGTAPAARADGRKKKKKKNSIAFSMVRAERLQLLRSARRNNINDGQPQRKKAACRVTRW